MKLYRHAGYEEYRSQQIRKNVKKFSKVFITSEEVDEIAQRVPRPVHFGICHGVRNGWEVSAFQHALEATRIIGTDISPTADTVDNCIVWDFHEVKPEWIGQVDFLYSNALDHSYDPELCLSRWMSCVSPEGVCVVGWHKGLLSRVDGADCFKASTRELEELISARYHLQEVLRHGGRTTFFIRRRQ